MDVNESLVILGRQPALGLAELESLYGASKVQPVGNEAALLHLMACSIDFSRLGGAMKLCKMLTVLETTKWPDIQKFLVQVAPGHAARMPEGKMYLGISAYGLSVKPPQIMATGLSVKKAIRATGRPVRLVPNQENALNTAQITHNKLLDDHGWELVFVRDGNKTICAQTVSVQDIDSYTIRDRGRPKRDARVGMLPPKLAQTIINLSTGQDEILQLEDQGNVCLEPRQLPELMDLRAKTHILDPFCGTGVILQEAALMGYAAYGTDLEPRMIEYSAANLAWLEQTQGIKDVSQSPLEVGDATTHQWQHEFQAVACETYLGQPFNTFPSAEKLEQVRGTCNVILEKFLQNIGTQVPSGTRLCLAVPAWQEKPGRYIHLSALDHLEKLGYNRVSFVHARTPELIYSREDQVVARELLVITRK